MAQNAPDKLPLHLYTAVEQPELSSVAIFAYPATPACPLLISSPINASHSVMAVMTHILLQLGSGLTDLRCWTYKPKSLF